MPVDGAFSNLDISVSAMRAERQRMDVVLGNLANASTTRSPEGGPYRRRQVVFESVLQEASKDGVTGGGVNVTEVVSDPTPFVKVHQPGHPDADAAGNVWYPNVKTSEEMVDLLSSSRAYDANAAAFRIAREMVQRALELLRS
jgi:flagellar basal-body rod protein FlgC